MNTVEQLREIFDYNDWANRRIITALKGNSSDKSLLTVTGLINNRSEQAHYVYYIVAKFVAKDISIKQAIIPIDIDIEPGKSKPFTHEISIGNIKSIVPETVKPMVVKYEYR